VLAGAAAAADPDQGAGIDGIRGPRIDRQATPPQAGLAWLTLAGGGARVRVSVGRPSEFLLAQVKYVEKARQEVGNAIFPD
jgi:hypothetical protein